MGLVVIARSLTAGKFPNTQPPVDTIQPLTTSFVPVTGFVAQDLSSLVSVGGFAMFGVQFIPRTQPLNTIYQITGSTSITFTQNTAPAINIVHNALSAPVKINSVSDFNSLGLSVRSTNLTMEVQTQIATFFMIFAPNVNITNEIGKKAIEEIIFYSEGVSEGINGKISNKDDLDFTSVDLVNQIADKLEWSGNSGQTLYDWRGFTMGFEP